MSTRKIDTTKRGIPAVWESGGGLTSGGSATIIAKRDGGMPRAVYIPRGGHLSCGEHALVPVHEGYYLVRAGVSRGMRSSATIERIVSTTVRDVDGEKWEASAEVETINTFSHGEWDKPLDSALAPAVEAAFCKAGTYHCRSAFYVDYSEKSEPSAHDKARRDAEQRRQDAERAALREAKAKREADAKAAAEAESRAAKTTGLGARMEAVNSRYIALGHKPLALGDSHIGEGWSAQLYTESVVVQHERNVAGCEVQAAEQEGKRVARETFLARFESFGARISALGVTVDYGPESVRLSTGGYYGHSYSEEGLAAFVAELDRREREGAEARAKADAEAAYQGRKSRAVALGLPSDVRIWCRRGGRTNAGDGWVVGSEGQDRGNTTWDNPRPRYPGEGDKIWEQILEGELVLRWSKSCSASEHEFEVVHQPSTPLTEAQLERVKEIQDELEQQWEGARGLASGLPSPSVGEGWGLLPKAAPRPEPAVMPVSEGGEAASPDALAALKKKFGKE